MPSLSDLGEFGLIERLVALLPPGEGVVLGPGDDAAVLERPDGPVLAAADLLVEGHHFDLAFSAPEDVGFKALAVNVSDIAAMGGTPRYALLSVGARADQPVEVVEALVRGVAEAARAFGVAVAGGDTVAAEQMIVSVAIVGDAPPGGAVRRSGARAGDLLCVTGSLGAAAAGLTLLRARETDATAAAMLDRAPALTWAHRRARARPREGAAAAAAGARAMIDISDGLLADVGHVCRASGVAVRIDPHAIPVAEGVAEVEAWRGENGWSGAPGARLATSGGDDYELAIAIAPEDLDGLMRALAPTPLAVLGSFRPGSGVEVAGVDAAGSTGADGEPDERAGWDHFRG